MDLEIIEKKVSEQRFILTVKGRLNAVTAPQLKLYVKKLTDRNNPEVILDLSQLVFMDSSGLAVFVSGMKLARERGGWIRLAGLSDQVASVFKMTMLDKVFELYPSVDAANR